MGDAGSAVTGQNPALFRLTRDCHLPRWSRRTLYGYFPPVMLAEGGGELGPVPISCSCQVQPQHDRSRRVSCAASWGEAVYGHATVHRTNNIVNLFKY